jgi:hypothetical protein
VSTLREAFHTAADRADRYREQRDKAVRRATAAEQRVAELEEALQETLWQIEHDPPLLPQAKAIAKAALKGNDLD